MGNLKSIEVQSILEWINSIYTDDSGEEYEVVFTRNYDMNIGYESRELVNVEKEGAPVYPEAPIWDEIQKRIQAVELERSCNSIKFSVEISRDWLESLDSLIELVLAGSKCSPEEALEIGIFSQIKEQLKQ